MYTTASRIVMYSRAHIVVLGFNHKEAGYEDNSTIQQCRKNGRGKEKHGGDH